MTDATTHTKNAILDAYIYILSKKEKQAAYRIK